MESALMNILVVNAGSSSHKLCLYHLKNEKHIDTLWKGTLDWSSKKASMTIETNHIKIEKSLANSNRHKGIEALLETIWNGPTKVVSNKNEITTIGHRVVHGGKLFEQPVIINKKVKDQIRKLIPLAPLHNPASLEEIKLFESLFPSLPQIAIFDTAFHLTMPEEVKTYPIPKKWRDLGIQRYGFHGISHQYCSERISEIAGNKKLKIVNCHLGNGCSLCAIHNGKSVTTTMGFTPLEGLMMGTRSGSIDPEILVYLMQEHGMQVEEISHQLNFESGLKGISGTSDMRAIIESTEPKHQLALKMFVFRLKSSIAEMAASMGGLDILSFTGGIGENSAPVRQLTCQGLEFLQIKLDRRLNASCEPDMDITHPDSKIRIFVIHTEEELLIAKKCFKLLK